ncbi:hypothetical protein A3Q56_04766 [Intoshia linei]|uniref:Cytochrome c oxidase assembly factor 6 n=1 Tax=Intoshia linei TaxID=1819745 RepID=A0A177AZL9_9BILA|nr:hypothetical protein A3Q56_04766 [Intoshia linei]
MTDSMYLRERREKCWKSRDLFHKCMSVYDEKFEKCKTQHDTYKNGCTKTWYLYFEKVRARKLFEKKQKSLDKEERSISLNYK